MSFTDKQHGKSQYKQNFLFHNLSFNHLLLCLYLPHCDALSDDLERNRIAKLGKGMEQAKFFADFFRSDVASQKLANELIISVLHKTQHHKHSINAAMRSQKGRRSAWPHCAN
jgi:hypothetical protein